LPGSTSAFVRILATDGVNTGEGDAGPFTVSGNEPTALINAPADEATYMPGENVLFAGEGFDLEDGPLADDALTWTSSLDGVLGTGGTVERADLSQGSHLITLTVRDSASNEATATITLNIRPPSCPGDCDGAGTVTVDELITLVNIALGTLEPSACPAGDANGDQTITVDEIILAVNAALSGCPAQSMPIPSAPPAAAGGAPLGQGRRAQHRPRRANGRSPARRERGRERNRFTPRCRPGSAPRLLEIQLEMHATPPATLLQLSGQL
jgi:hypothetical protein